MILALTVFESSNLSHSITFILWVTVNAVVNAKIYSWFPPFTPTQSLSCLDGRSADSPSCISDRYLYKSSASSGLRPRRTVSNHLCLWEPAFVTNSKQLEKYPYDGTYISLCFQILWCRNFLVEVWFFKISHCHSIRKLLHFAISS